MQRGKPLRNSQEKITQKGTLVWENQHTDMSRMCESKRNRLKICSYVRSRRILSIYMLHIYIFIYVYTYVYIYIYVCTHLKVDLDNSYMYCFFWSPLGVGPSTFTMVHMLVYMYDTTIYIYICVKL